MQSGRLLIDDIDIYTTYGAYMVEGGLNDVVQWPPLKDVDSVDWHEYDGEEYDLDAPVLDARDIDLNLCVRTIYGLEELRALLTVGAYHTFNFAGIGRELSLRLIKSDISTWADSGLYIIELTLSDDNPLDGYTYVEPVNDLSVTTDYDYNVWFDSRTACDYGVRVLKGTLKEIYAVADVKENMLRDIAVSAGVEYDSGVVTYESRDVKLYLLMTTGTPAFFWQNWDALLYSLTTSGEHVLFVGNNATEYDFYYKKCEVSEVFFDDDRVWCQFTLTLRFTNS